MKQQPGDWSTNFWGIPGYRWRFGTPMSCERIFRGGHTDCVFDVAWGTDARSNGALLAWRPNLRSWRGDFSNCPWWLHVLFFVDMFFFLGGGCFNFPESLCIFSFWGGGLHVHLDIWRTISQWCQPKTIEENPARMTTENRRNIQFLTSWTFGTENLPQIIRMFFFQSTLLWPETALPPKNGEI